jgi:hypothetical protein
MSVYAANDCDAIKQIINRTKIIDEIQLSIPAPTPIFAIELTPLNLDSHISQNEILEE